MIRRLGIMSRPDMMLPSPRGDEMIQYIIDAILQMSGLPSPRGDEMIPGIATPGTVPVRCRPLAGMR